MVYRKRAVFAAILGFIAFLWLGTAAFTAPPGNSASPYIQWANGPSTDPNFFPIGVWLQSPNHIQEFKNIGINMFIGFWGSLDQTSLSDFSSGTMPVVPDQNSVGLTSPQNKWIQAWHTVDEPDNAQPNGNGGYGPCILPSQLVAAYNTIEAHDTTRPVFLNFGRGVSDIHYVGRGTCTGDTSYYPAAMQGGDIISFDIYPVANYSGQLELIPNGVDNLRTWANGKKIIWNFVEGADINGGAVPTSDQIRAEVWMSLIHGSQGIIYFVHQLSPTFREDGIFNYPTIVQAVTNINAQVTSLAPVLNSPSILNDVQVSSNSAGLPINIIEKQLGGATYVFAVDMRNNSATATFTVPGVSSGTAVVIGENRQVTISNGKFQDSFAPYAVHLYQFTPAVGSIPNPPTNLNAIVH